MFFLNLISVDIIRSTINGVIKVRLQKLCTAALNSNLILIEFSKWET